MITRVRVIAGRALRHSRSEKGVVSSTLANVGRTGHSDPKIRIKIYATKNSGNDIVVKDVTFTVLSYSEFLYKALVMPRNSDSGTAIKAVKPAKKSVFQSRGAIRSATSLDRPTPPVPLVNCPLPENELPKSPCKTPPIQFIYRVKAL